MRDESGQLFYNGLIVDVTRQRNAEEQARSLREKLEASERLESLGLLAGGLAHDFNNILTVLEGFAHELAELAGDSAQAHKLLAEVKQQIDAGAGVTTQLLGYAGKGNYRSVEADLSQIFRSVAEALIRTRKDVRLGFDAPGPAWTRGDAAQLERVAMNLVINALEAMPEGGTLEIQVSRASPVSQRIRVADTGVGIVDETRRRMFEPFFSTKSAHSHGVGLGLAAVWGIVESLAGDIEVESTPGRGTCFTLKLPACDPPAVATAATRRRVAAAGQRALRVLVVDDEEPVRRVIGLMLERLGHTATLVASGNQALRALQMDGSYDAVILDLVMPSLSGDALIRAIEAGGDSPPILVCSGYATDDQCQSAFARGARGMLKKPVRPEELELQLAGL